MFFTFYSFKGGVGRSMTLANLAEMLYRRGFNVLMVDFDVEAPGLERYFDTPENLSEKRGVIDMVLSYKTLSSLSPTTETNQKQTLEEFAKSIEPLANFVSTIYPEQNGAGLYLMTAGRRPKDDYRYFSERVSRLDWDDFYVNCNGAMFFDWVRSEASRYFDVVLVDSRTGITEMTGICTYHLADAVIMFVAPNQQNLEGTLLIANGLRKRAEQEGTKRDRKIELLILPSRIDTSESSSVQDFKIRFLELMVPFLNSTLKFENSPFDDLKVPYIARYAFYEKVAAREPDLSVATEMLGAFNRMLAAMREISNKNSRFYRRFFSTNRSASIIAEDSWLPKAPESFIGRFWVFNAIDQWLASDTGSTLLIQGEPGSGKSALALRLLQISRGEVENQDWSYIVPGLLVYAQFCNAVNVHSYDPAYFVKSLSLALANRYPAFATALTQTRETDVRIDVRQSIGAALSPGAQVTGVVIESLELVNPDVMRGLAHLVTEPLAKLYSQGFTENPVILVDDLNVATSLVSENNILNLIALIVRRLPQVRFILTSRPDPRVMAELPGAEIIDLVSHSESLNEDIRSYVERGLDTFPTDKRSILVDQILRAAQGNFLYAERAVTELKATTDLKAFDPKKLPVGMLGFYRDDVANQTGSDIERWKTRDGLFLGVLALQKGNGLSSSQLSGILGWTETEMIRIFRDWRQYLTRDWPHAPFHFFHDSFQNFLLTNTEYPVSSPKCHQLIADYFVKQYGTDWSSCEDEYALDYTSAHLLDALNSATEIKERKAIQEKLTAVLTDPDFLQVRGRRVGLEGLLKELEEAPLSAGILGNVAMLYTELGRSEEALATYERAVKLAQADNDRRLENALLGNLGVTLADLGLSEKAIKTYQEAVTLARAIGDRQSEATHVGNLGLAYHSVGHLDAAIESLSQALRISRELGVKRQEAFWLLNLGYVYVGQRKFEEGINHYTEALSISQSLQDLASSATLFRNLGVAYEALSHYDKAVENYRQAATIMQRLDDKNGLAWLSVRYGNMLVNTDQLNQAVEFYQMALTTWDETGETALAAQVQVNLGIVLARQNALDEAVSHFQQALVKMEAVRDLEGRARVLLNLGNVAVKQERLDEARTYYLEAVDILKEVGLDVDAGQAWNNLGTIYRRQGDWKEAIESYSRSLDIAKKLGARNIQGDVLSNLANAFQGLGDLGRAEGFYEDALEVFQELGDEKGVAVVRERLQAVKLSHGQSHTLSDGDIVIDGSVRGSKVQLSKGASTSMAQNIRRSELDDLLMPLTDQIRNAPPELLDQVSEGFQVLKTELAKGNQADDRVVARTADKLISQVPAAGETLADLLTSPRLGNFVGPVTLFVIEKFLESSPSDNRKNA